MSSLAMVVDIVVVGDGGYVSSAKADLKTKGSPFHSVIFSFFVKKCPISVLCANYSYEEKKNTSSV